MSAIEIKDLRFRYRDSRKKDNVLDKLDLSISSGEFICILGPSGCGKSTLLRLMAGLEKPAEGSVCIDGVSVAGPGADRMIVFQDYALFPWMTAKNNVRFAVIHAKHISIPEADRIAKEILERVGLREGMNLYPFQLSGGMKQRVAIARALAMDTEILILDEPFGALDAKNRASLQELLIELWHNKGGKQKTVVFVTHDIGEAVLLADKIIVMQPGRIREEVSIDIPRPRTGTAAAALKRQLLELFEVGADAEVT